MRSSLHRLQFPQLQLMQFDTLSGSWRTKITETSPYRETTLFWFYMVHFDLLSVFFLATSLQITYWSKETRFSSDHFYKTLIQPELVKLHIRLLKKNFSSEIS